VSRDTFEPTPARRGFELLLERHPHLDVVAAWIPGRPEDPWLTPSSVVAPWLRVELGQPSEGEGVADAYAVWSFAIWRSTGAVHTVDADGAVSDDPVLELEASS
jgi:hypothetical protein